MCSVLNVPHHFLQHVMYAKQWRMVLCIGYGYNYWQIRRNPSCFCLPDISMAFLFPPRAVASWSKTITRTDFVQRPAAVKFENVFKNTSVRAPRNLDREWISQPLILQTSPPPHHPQQQLSQFYDLTASPQVKRNPCQSPSDSRENKTCFGIYRNLHVGKSIKRVGRLWPHGGMYCSSNELNCVVM